MAIARMSHIRLIGLRRQENKILDILTSNGMFEPRATDNIGGKALHAGDDSLCRELKLKQSRISFALDFLRGRHEFMADALEANARAVKKGKGDPSFTFELPHTKFSGSKMLITHADFSDVRAKEYDLLGVCDALQELSFKVVDCKTRENALIATAKQYEPYRALPLKFSELGKRGDVNIVAFYNPSSAAAPEELTELKCAYDVRTGGGTLIVVACRECNLAAVVKAMSAGGFERCAFTDDCTAAQKLDGISAERGDISRERLELTKQAIAYEKYYNELRILYDVIELEVERAEASAKFLSTDSTFVLEGWLPAAIADGAVAAIREKFPRAFIQLLAPEEKDVPPTLLVNHPLVQPYEDVTNSFNPPKFNEFDPNPIMSVFYFVFFGIMVGDAAYGLILAVIGLVLGYSNKLAGGTKRLFLLVGWGGVSAIIWGVLFGGYFSIDFGVNVALWFNPLDDPITLLVLSLAMGVVQLTAGYVIKFVLLCKEGKPLDALCDPGPIILIFAALVFVAMSLLVTGAPAWMLTVGIVLAVTGCAVIVIFGGRHKKGVVGKVFGGLPGLYGLINLLSDVLSYSRIFGLCLASGAIGMAFNILASILFEIPVVGYVIGVVLLIPLHALNLGLGVISAYVHDSRLQFLEFYGKFYEGGGRLFAPLGSRAKHTRFA